MASESSVTGQSISELTEVNKLGDDTKEEEKHEPEDVSVADEINKEEEHKHVSSSSEPVVETNEGKPNDVVDILTSKEPVNSAVKQEDLKAAEVAQTSENEIKPESSSDNVEIKLVESEDSKDDVHELVHTEVPIVVFPDASVVPEEIDVDRRNLEAESGSPEEHKPEESAETKPNVELIKSEGTKGEVHELVPAEISGVDSKAPEENNADSITPTTIDVPLKHPESYSVSLELKKPECGEIKEHVELSMSEDSEKEVHELVPTEVSINAEAREKRDVDLSAHANVEVPVKDIEVESSSPEEQKAEVGAESEVKELINSGYSKEEGQELVSEQVPTVISEAVKKNVVHSSVPTSAEVPLKDLVSSEVPMNTSEESEENDVDLSAPTSTAVSVKNLENESSSPGEQKPEEGRGTDVNIELTETGESGFPDERKLEEGSETKVNVELIESGDSKNEGWEPVSAEVRTNNSEQVEKNDVDSSTPTSIEVPVKDLEVEFGSPTEQQLEESAETKVNIEFIKSGETKDEGHDLFSGEVSTNSSEAPEINYTELSTPTSTELHVKDVEVDSSSIEEQKLEESAETKVVNLIESGDSKDAGQESVSSKVSTNTSEEPENNNVDSSSSTSIEVPAKDLEVESGSPEEQKIDETSETSINIKLIESGDSKVEGQESVSTEVPASTSEEPEDNNADLITPTGIEVPVKDLEVEFGFPEEQKIEESAETKVNTEFIKSKDEGQASGEVPTISSHAPEIIHVNLSIPTSTEVPAEDLEVDSGSPEEQKPEEGAETEVNIKLIESGDSKVEGQESVSAEVPASISEEPEDSNADLSPPTGIEVPVKDLEIESGSPEENKFEGSAEIKVNTDFIKSGESKDEGRDLVPGKVPTNTSEAPQINAVDLSAASSIKVPVKDLEVEFGSPEEQKPVVNIELTGSGDSKVEGQEFVFAEVPDNTSNAPEKEDVELSTPTSTEVPLKDLEVKSVSPEEQKLEESVETNVDIKSIKLGDSKDEGQESVFVEVPTNASEEHEHNNVDLTSPTSTEVPVKDLEVESGSADEQNPKESVEAKDPSLYVTRIDGGGDVAGSSSYEYKSSGVGEVVDKEDAGLKEEVIQSRIEEDQTLFGEDKVSEAVAEVFPAEVVEERKDETFEVDSAVAAPKLSEVSLTGGNVLEEDVNVEAIERDLAETSIDSNAGGVSSGQATIPENVEVEPLELKFDELSPETRDVPSVGERVSAVDVKSETSKGKQGKGETSGVDNTDTAPNVSEVSSAVGNVLEKDVNVDSIERDLTESSIDSSAGGVSTEQAKNRENVEVEPLELKFDEFDVSPEASSVGDSVPANDGKTKEETSEADNTDSKPNVSEVSLAVGNVLEKDVNFETVERDLAETAIDSTVGGDTTEQAKIPENEEVKPLELKFEVLNPEASQVPSVGERVSSADVKSENSKGETGATSAETPKDNATSDESLAHLVEDMETESSKSESEASVEQLPEAVKEIVASESYNEKKDETPRDVSLVEKNTNINQDKKTEVKVEEVIENAPEHEELGIEKREGGKPKDEEPIVSTDTRDVRLIKETTKRDSNIFTKMKRSIIKAKKAILGKSPGPKTVSSETKDENI